MSPRSEFLAGIKDLLPSTPGIVMFSVVVGVAAAGAGVSVMAAAMMGLLVFAGSAQLVAFQMVAAGVPVPVILFSVLIINLRLVMYSMSVAPHFRYLPLKWKALLAHMLTDQVYAFTVLHFESRPDSRHKHWYTLGAGLTLGVPWVIAGVAGFLLGASIPRSWSLDFTLALTFIGLVAPAVKDRGTLAAALTAGVVVVAAVALPMRLGLITAALAGMAAGAWVERWKTR